jgi:CRP-like cAMP-binding protein
VLARLAPAIGREVGDGLEMQVTNEELASAANITPFTASRILSEWQDGSVVTKRRGRIILHSPGRLFSKTA